MTAILRGQSGLLNCTARGSPEPVISWTKNGEPLDLDDGRFEIFENGSLFLRDVRLNDMGDYKCNATNELGFDESDDAMLMINSECMPTIHVNLCIIIIIILFVLQCIQYLWQYLYLWYTWN